MECTSCGLCEPYDGFYWCDHHKTEIYNPNNAGCGNCVEKEDHSNIDASEKPEEKISNKISYE